MVGLAIVAVAFVVVGIPVLSVIGLRAYWLSLLDKQVKGLFEERKLLIEKGVTDLAALELPQMAAEARGPDMPQAPLPTAVRTRVRSVTLWAGVMLLGLGVFLIAIGVALSTTHGYRGGAAPGEELAAISGAFTAAIGLLMLIIHVFIRAFGRREHAVAEAGEGAAPPRMEMVKKTDRLCNLKAGIVLLFLSATLVSWEFLTPAPVRDYHPQLQIAILLAAVGLALLVIHALTGYYERRGRGEQEPLGQDSAAVIEVDIEE